MEIEGKLDRLEVADGISATGKGSDAVHSSGEIQGVDSIDLEAADGQTLVRAG